ncbi:hypothetical protein IPU75_05110 [Ochrobactrum sp. SD129]|nr:hypothetical protein [Ochrobactrum sp. SD129]
MTPNTMLAYDNMEQTITEWALDYGITPGIIIARLERGMTTADAITTPMQVAHRCQRLPIFHKKQLKRGERVKPKITRIQNIRLLTAFGQSMTLKQWADHIGVKEMTLHARLKRKSLEDALTMPKQSRGPKIKTERPGVPSDFTPSKGTGAGSAFQESPNLTFSKEAAE